MKLYQSKGIRSRRFLLRSAPLMLLLVLVLVSGCASYMARKRLEGVAKGWCQMIRASQVIAVYPPTGDLSVGDVFLTQMTIHDQAKQYEGNGFLPLDDFQVRLPYTNFSNIYFDGYWKDQFGGTNVPHPLPVFTNNVGAFTNTLTAAPLPRAAFPTYTVQAQSGSGFNAAFPIDGIPIALSYLNSQQVNASITIADARTYAGDPSLLYDLLKTWAANTNNKSKLLLTANNMEHRELFLRVVSRIYYARAIDVSLQRASSQGGGAKGGSIADVNLMTNGSVTNATANYSNVLSTLNSSASSLAGAVSNATQVGASVKFTAASSSTVALSESFDSLLAIGYLGFDVPVYTNGEIGYPIPTFQHLTSKAATPAPNPVRYGADTNTTKIAAWLKEKTVPTHDAQLREWLGDEIVSKYGETSIIYGGQFAQLRAMIVAKFNIP